MKKWLVLLLICVVGSVSACVGQSTDVSTTSQTTVIPTTQTTPIPTTQTTLIPTTISWTTQLPTTMLPTTDQTTTTTEVSLLLSQGQTSKIIRTVDNYPLQTTDFRYFDYRSRALWLDDIVFTFAQNPNAVQPTYIQDDPESWQPIGFWIDQARQPEFYDPLVSGYLKRTFGLPTYLGDNRVLSSGSEAITSLAMVLSSSLMGLVMDDRTYGEITYDFVEMMLAHYDTGSKLVHNAGVQGQSFWYDIFPQILFAKLYDLYPETEYMREMVLNGANEWLEALPYFETDGSVDFEFVGYNVTLESPTVTGGHIEPPNGGLAFLFYSAYVMTQDEAYLDGAKAVLDYFQDYQKNPNYEAMTDYAPLIAAILNFYHGTHYDVGKFLDFLFEGDSAFRPGWSVMSGSLGGKQVSGLVGQTGDYAFSMNTFHLASVLAPLVKYDARYTDTIGKYLYNVYQNARLFFPTEHSLSQQTMTTFLSYDLYGSICYEGFRGHYGGVDGLAMGDATAMFNQPSDLSLYSAAFLGGYAGMIEAVESSGLILYDLNVTDAFGKRDYPYYLAYNPTATDQTLRFAGPDHAYDVFDLTHNQILARNVLGSISLTVEAQSGIAFVLLPPSSNYHLEAGEISVNGDKIASLRPAVNTLLPTRAQLTQSSVIPITFEHLLDDPITEMHIYFGNILAYSGVPITEFSYDKGLLPDTDYEMKIVITTQSGLVDYVTKRVICY